MSDYFTKDTCCCGVSVHTGTKINAVLFIIISVILGLANQSLSTLIPVAIKIIVAVLLYYGVQTKRPYFYWPYLIHAVIETLMFLIKTPISFWFAVKDHHRVKHKPVEFMIMFCLFIFLLTLFVIFVDIIVPLRSYNVIKKENESKKSPTPNVTAAYAPAKTEEV